MQYKPENLATQTLKLDFQAVGIYMSDIYALCDDFQNGHQPEVSKSIVQATDLTP